MTQTLRLLGVSLAALFVTSCATTANHQSEPVMELVDRMTGSFNSAAQSKSDKRYFDINLEMIRIWPERTDAIYLYVEQAVSAQMSKPYRQRVYKVTASGRGSFVSEVYALPDPERAIGAWQDQAKLANITPEHLILRQGCAIELTLTQGNFIGSTKGKACTSKLRGASYATSKVEIEPEQLTSWDQGFDDNDIQVWGAQAGPYIFDKIRNYAAD